MLRTVTIGSCVSIQGIFVKALNDGRIRIRVGNRLYEGLPVEAVAA